MDGRALFAPSQVCRGGGRRGKPVILRLGFSLTELLVVVSIAALMTSILVPALNKAKANAREVMCKSQLRELGRIWKFYAEDNDGRFPERGCGYSEGAVSWFHCIRDYYPNMELILCPMAMKTYDEGGRNPRMAWQNTTDFGVYYKGSYGINLWVSNGADPDCGGAGPNFNVNCWRTPGARGASYAPLLLCSQWKDIQPYPTDEPPEHALDMWTPGPLHEMRRGCIKRHNPYHVQVLFLDWSVHKKTIKELWRLKWHKNWPADYPLPVWPDWMADVPDPD